MPHRTESSDRDAPRRYYIDLDVEKEQKAHSPVGKKKKASFTSKRNPHPLTWKRPPLMLKREPNLGTMENMKRRLQNEEEKAKRKAEAEAEAEAAKRAREAEEAARAGQKEERKRLEAEALPSLCLRLCSLHEALETLERLEPLLRTAEQHERHEAQAGRVTRKSRRRQHWAPTIRLCHAQRLIV